MPKIGISKPIVPWVPLSMSIVSQAMILGKYMIVIELYFTKGQSAAIGTQGVLNLT